MANILDKNLQIFQLIEYFISKHNYEQIIIKREDVKVPSGVYLYNFKNKNYQLIYLNVNSSSYYEYEKNEIELNIKSFCKLNNVDKLKFLHIHITNDKYDKDNEPNDYINIEENYYDGIELSNVYPGLKNVIHPCENPKAEVDKIVDRLKRKRKPSILRRKYKFNKLYIVTYIVMALCIINYLLGVYLKFKYDDLSSIYVFLGAEYKTFTLGLKQVYRLFTYAFVHSDIIHLLCNLSSASYIFKYVEDKYGHWKFIIILTFCILCGGLSQGILTDNSICLGLSAGVYGMLFILVYDVYKTKIISIVNLVPTILLNLSLNFLSTTAWIAHIGGLIGGIVMYFLFEDEKKIPRIALCLVLLCSLVFKYFTIDHISPLYGGTDLNVVEIIKDFGLNKTSSKILLKLIDVYSKYGG